YGGGFRDNEGNRAGFASQNYSSPYDSPGWRRAQANRQAARGGSGFSESSAGYTRRGATIDAKARVVSSASDSAKFKTGERVFHQKFGYGRIVGVEGEKLLVDFDKAGSKRVMDGFVTKG